MLKKYIPAILEIVVVILALYWLKNKLSKTKSDDKKIKDEDNEKPETDKAALYIICSIIFGFLVVKAITTF